MSNYRFYRTTTEKAKELLDEQSPNNQKRQDILTDLVKEQGAVAYYLENNGRKEVLTALVVANDNPILKEKHISIVDRAHFEGQEVAVVRGKRNSKKGKDFNRLLEKTQERINEHPPLDEWLIEKYDLFADALVNENGRMGLSQTVVGLATTDEGDIVVARIPKSEKKTVTPPDWMEEITHGQFIDIVERSEVLNKNK